MKQEETNDPGNPLHHSSAVAVYHWRGARPWLLDLTAEDSGWLLCLCLQREGDVALLPLAWEQNAPAADTPGSWPFSPQAASFHGDALDAEACQLTLRDLESDGWQVNGRLTLHFSGRQGDPDFWSTIQQSLWQSKVQGTAHEDMGESATH